MKGKRNVKKWQESTVAHTDWNIACYADANFPTFAKIKIKRYILLFMALYHFSNVEIRISEGGKWSILQSSLDNFFGLATAIPSMIVLHTEGNCARNSILFIALPEYFLPPASLVLLFAGRSRCIMHGAPRVLSSGMTGPSNRLRVLKATA